MCLTCAPARRGPGTLPREATGRGLGRAAPERLRARGRASRASLPRVHAVAAFLLATATVWAARAELPIAHRHESRAAFDTSTEGGTRELVIFAAASLKDVLSRIDASFEQAHPGVRVTTSVAGSQELRVQIEHGAAADVFVSADEPNMAALAAKGLVATPAVFACNELAVAARRDLPAAVSTLADLPHVERLVVGTPASPIGRYTDEVLRRAGADLGDDFVARVMAKVVSRELNVKQVLAKVVLGEADAAFVYRTDVWAAGGKVRLVVVPAAWNVVARYPAAVLGTAPHATLARAWLAAAAAAPAQRLLEAAGFSRCPPP